MTIAPERPTAVPADVEELTVSTDPYDRRTTPENFDFAGWFARFDRRLLATSEGRRILTRLDPMLFALIYLRKHLRNALGEITFADAHFLWARAARRWIGPSRGPREDRRAFVAPRDCGKSTWWFLILPLWAGFHGHAKFAAAFADSGSQSELHLATFKRELSDNPLLRKDFPDFCEPARRHNGKALDLDTPLLTANRGWATMAGIEPGDRVFHPAGHDVEVVEVMDVRHNRPCYRVTTTDGRSVIADAEHLWTVLDRRHSISRGPRGAVVRTFPLRTVTTQEMIDTGLSRCATGGRTTSVRGKSYITNEYRYQLPRQEPIKSSDIDLPIDPYLFGAWLGDGNSGSAHLTTHESEVSHWTEAVRQAGWIPIVRSQRTAWQISMTTEPGRGQHSRSFAGRLRGLGVLKNKHVPDLYLTAGTGQREALLQGLLDTDGTIEAKRGQVEFCSTKRTLADGVLYLARSLGWRATLREARATLNGRDCGPKYRVMFTPVATDPFRPFRLARKAARVRPADGGKGRAVVSIANIEPVESRPVRCIQVDSPDGLFLAGRDLVPTHNTINDSQQMLYTKSGFAFAARGIDSTSLGMKVDEVRPDLIIFDDIEPPEATYSDYQKRKRLSTVQNAILPLNERARVVLVGTVTMPGSIVHELVRESKGELTDDDEAAKWIAEEKFKTHHTRAITRRSDGSRRSVWPEKWPMAYLESIEHTRSYKLNFDNDPRGREGRFWNADDFRYGAPAVVTRKFLFLDPPVTQKSTSDACGLAVVGYSPAGRGLSVVELLKRLGIEPPPRTATPQQRKDYYKTFEHFEVNMHESEVDPQDIAAPTRLSRAVIYDAWGRQVTGKNLKKHVLETLIRFPGIEAVIVENNQGGDLWLEVLDNLPVKLITYGATESKEVRFQRALDRWQGYRVLMARPMTSLEDQLTSFPMGSDDIADAACAGVLRLLPKPKPKQANRTLTPR